MPDRANRVNDIARRQIVTARHFRLTGRASAEPTAFVQETRTGGAMNRAIDAATAEQRRVGGIDDRINPYRRDVCPECLDRFYQLLLSVGPRAPLFESAPSAA